jgi:thiol-disulfide isomerase/thioredoxin
MKKGIVILFLFSSITFLCPAQTIRKTFFEDYTGAWCGYCPEGTQILEKLAAENPANIIVVATHSLDGLAIKEGTEVIDGIGIDGYPSGFPGEGLIGLNRGYWTTLFDRRKKVPALATIGFAGFKYLANNDTYEVDVNVAFTLPNEKSGVPIVVNIYVLEDSIPAVGPIAQSNFIRTIQGGASPLSNWYHIPYDPVLNEVYTQKFSFKIPGYVNKEQVRLVAYVAYNGTAKNNEKEIINAEEMRLSGTTGIKENVREVAVLGGYPNPLRKHETFKLEYHIPKGGRVQMCVYNLLGQLVTRAIESEEVAGAHTLHWNPSEFGLQSGMYLLKINAGTSSQTVVVNVL